MCAHTTCSKVGMKTQLKTTQWLRRFPRTRNVCTDITVCHRMSTTKVSLKTNINLKKPLKVKKNLMTAPATYILGYTNK